MLGYFAVSTISGGRWVAEIYGCNLEVLENPKLVELALRDAVFKLGAPPGSVQATVYKFYPQGLSAAVLSPVAAVMMHTWPEDKASAALDLYFYKHDVDPESVLRGLARAFGAQEESAFRFWRGNEHEIKRRTQAAQASDSS
ncbi:S-adenosylmethionine decarboxylase related protein [Meiothermus taiwanensis WR-220]|jgi:S-adenosylmethionine decarboxylase|uniref:S-adenosylmethionine decarboxylase proenzyme n=2 Tax=Meiothermus taiwanensis TaxID=172827 RepID=A0A399E3U8_9DEIN|nr:S-adenosylmethionine decarboxylase related protein [Meiothermus taiwanensis WR-220]KIQ55561.1 S-adenosylmethionine decarboxylase [Meiothermus taiwanensis]KZK15996.1 S-adenosylmethionine decarboxylase [Meiothermus taiwanensis]RIH78598.1 S-adenosylmethionine decarboxylase proenzyme [Meiothermus taiwanensis]